MFVYNQLSVNRKVFVDAALKIYPDLVKDKIISRQQIQTVVESCKINYPQWFCNNASNRVTRGTFHFPVPSSAEVLETIVEKTDDDIKLEIEERFATINTCVRSVSDGTIKALILSGPPGIGKTHEVYETLNEMADTSDCNFVFLSGRSKATGLYKLLYDNRFSNSVLVLDDIDSVFEHLDSLNVLKAACDLKRARNISWLSEARFVSDEDGEEIPNTFTYEGSIIFITNYNFDQLINKGSKISPHLEALISRSLYINVGLDTYREKLIRIRQVLDAGMLSKSLGFSNEESDLMYSFIEEHHLQLREVSLRMCQKLATLYKMNKSQWMKIAGVTCFK